MAGAAMTAQGAGTVLGAWGSYQNGLAQDAYYKSLAANARTQAALVEGQANQEITSAQNQGAQETNLLNRKTKEIEGEQAAGVAFNGVAGSTTASDIARDTFTKSKMDQLAIKYNADVASWRAQNNANLQKWNLENEARYDEVAGKNAKKAGKIGAVTSLLSGASQVASTWAKSRPYATDAQLSDPVETPSYLKNRQTRSNRIRLY